MKKTLIILTTILTFVCANSYAQMKNDRTEDEKAIRRVVQNITDAWTAGDGVKYADNFTDDVDYTVWNGHQIHGREENIKGHQEIFDTFYKGTNVKFEINKIRFLTDEIAAVHLQAEMFKDGKKVEDVPQVVPLMIFQKTKGKWNVAVFQNTPIIKRGELQLRSESEK